MEQLTSGETTIFIGSIIFGLIVFFSTVAGIIYFFKRIAKEDRAEEEKFSQQPTGTDENGR